MPQRRLDIRLISSFFFSHNISNSTIISVITYIFFSFIINGDIEMSIESTIKELETQLNELKASIKPKRYKLNDKMAQHLSEKRSGEIVTIGLAFVNNNTMLAVMDVLIKLYYNPEEGLEGVKYDDNFIDFNGTCIPECYLECIS